jgi:glycosyltransferase involved in cell wall biosynthesis
MSPSEPRVSVVIPAYNAEATIADAVASARQQTFRPDEIIVVDDASSDRTFERLEALHGPDLKLIRQAENRGGAAARNRGVDAATGDFVAFLDADDLWEFEKLELQLQALHRARPNSYCFTAVWQTNEYGETWMLPRRGPRAAEPIADFLLKGGNVVQTSTLLVPRPCARSIDSASACGASRTSTSCCSWLERALMPSTSIDRSRGGAGSRAPHASAPPKILRCSPTSSRSTAHTSRPPNASVSRSVA